MGRGTSYPHKEVHDESPRRTPRSAHTLDDVVLIFPVRLGGAEEGSPCAQEPDAGGGHW